MGYSVRKINLKNLDDTLVYDSTDENIENYFGNDSETKKSMKNILMMQKIQNGFL